MDRRLELLRAFYASLSAATVKLETDRYGFDYLEELTRWGARLEYGELTAHRTLHKYKLAGVPPAQWDALLAEHVAKRINVCQYFGLTENALFAFNLDNNRRDNNTELIPEVTGAVNLLRSRLEALGCRPLVIASGRGFHVWCRLAAPRPNAEIYAFMLNRAVEAAAAIHGQELDRHRVRFSFYPDPRTENRVSLRLFGSEHAKTKVFSRVATADGLLSEEDSWAEFERHVAAGPIALETFARAARAQ